MAKRNDAVSKWRNRIDYALQIQKDYDGKYGFTRAAMEYRGEYQEAMKSLGVSLAGIAIVAINEVKAFVRTFLPSVYSRDPRINVNPQGKASIKPAKILEKAINALWRELGIKQEVRRCIVDACLSPWGWVKVGYSAVFGTHDIEEGETQFESNEYIKKEEFFVTRESYKNVVYDPNAINAPHDCRWMAHRIIKPREAVKNSSIYKNTDDLEGGVVSEIDYLDSNKKKRKYTDDPQVTLWEIWDKDSNKVITIADGCGEVLLEKEWPYPNEFGFPFVGLTFDVNPDENYPQNYVGAWEPQLWEKIKLRSMILDHLKRFGRQMAAEEGSMKPSEKSKFEAGQTGSVIEYRKGRTPPTPVQYPPIQSDMYAVMNAVESDKDNISGQAAIMRGAPQKTQTRTIGEVRQIAASGEGRNADPVDLIETFSEQIAYKLSVLMQTFTSIPKFVRMTQEEFEKVQDAFEGTFDGTGFEYTGENIQGRFDIDIVAGSTLPLDRNNRIKLSEQMLRNAPAFGIAPGSKVATVLGRSVIADLEMYEVEQAFDEQLAEMQAQQEAMAQIAAATGQGVAAGGMMPALGGAQRGRPPKQGGQP